MIVLDGLAGTQINERYALGQVIGRGASGVVYRAQDADGATVALKLVSPGGRAEHSARYLRGTRLAAELKHPHIVEVLDSGRWGPERRCFYLSMEMVEGVSLARLQELGLPSEQLVGLLIQVLEAVAYVHARGTLHRDLKPDNVMVSRTPKGQLICKVTDFGIASNQQREASVTQTGALIGTPAYMAPEQAQARTKPGPECDLYAIGIMLYELLSGQRPFVGSPLTIFYQKINDEPTPLAADGPLPPALVKAVMQLIERRPEDRTAHARDAIEALRPFSAPPQLEQATWDLLVDWQDDTGLAPTVVGLVGAKSRSASQVEGAHEATVVDAFIPALWGRAPLLEQLDEFAHLAESGDPRVLLLSGRIGVGKSALMREFSIRLQEQGRFQVLSTTFFGAYGQEGGLRGAVALHLGTRGHSVTTVRTAVDEHLRRFGDQDPAEAQALVDWLCPHPRLDETGSVNAASDFSPGVRYLRRLARTRPVLLLIDDLHAGGAHSAALIEYLIFEFGFDPWSILVVGVTEPRGGADFQAGLKRSAHAEGRNRHTIPIDALPIPELAKGLRQALGISMARAQRLSQRAAGNPLVALGLAQALSEHTQSTESPAAANPAMETGDSPLRAMLERCLQGALAQVTDLEAAQKMLQAVALLGPWVDVETLAHFLEVAVDELSFETLLDDLVERDVLEEDPTPGADRVCLKPLALAEVILDTLGKRQLKRLRRRAIDVLAKTDGVDHGVLGDHYHALGNRADAIKAWTEAERRALRSGAPHVAVDQGLKILAEAQEPERTAWGIHLGRILLDAGDAGRAERLLYPVATGPHTDDALVAADLLCDVYENMGKGAEWTKLVDRIRARLESAGRIGQHAAHCALAMWSTTHSDDQGGRRSAEKAMELAESAQEIRRAAQRLAFSCLPGGDVKRAEEAAKIALEASGKRNQMRVRSLRTLATVNLWQGNISQAMALNEEALKTARWLGLSLRATLALHDLGDTLRIKAVQFGRGSPERHALLTQALERYDACIRGTEALDLASTTYLVLVKKVICRVAMGDEFDVASVLAELVGPAEAAGLGLARPCANLILAWSLAREDKPDEARKALEGARILEAFRIDPQVPAIFAEIRTRLND